MTNQTNPNSFSISIATLDSDLYAAVVGLCSRLDIDPTERLTFKNGTDQFERSVADVIRDALYVSAIGRPPAADIGIWRSA